MAYSEQEVLAELAAIITEEAGIPAENVTAEKSFVDDLDVDSLTVMTILASAEDKFDITIDEDASANFTTVGDAVNYIVAAQA